MHRMNEELYQHWIALKDIKTLSNRLGSFNKLAKIYDDIPFNSQLFLWTDNSDLNINEANKNYYSFIIHNKFGLPTMPKPSNQSMIAQIVR